MRRKIALLLAAVLSLGLVACGMDDRTKSSENKVPADSQAKTSANGSTVLTAAADAHNSQTLYLWEEGNAPATTVYTENNGNYSDDPDFRPYLVSFPVPEGTEVKGAVLICAGGAFQFRSDENEGTPVAEELASRGYQSFVVNYRLRPYTQEEGALDLARAVRFVHKNADAVEAAGVRVERLQLDGRPHGFGYREDWFNAYDDFLMDAFAERVNGEG